LYSFGLTPECIILLWATFEAMDVLFIEDNAGDVSLAEEALHLALRPTLSRCMS
jgi:hypothetical protein